MRQDESGAAAEYKRAIQAVLAGRAKDYRASRGISQENMAERLRISARSYSDLERGVCCFSAVSLLFFLLLLPEGQVTGLLEEIRVLVEGEDKNVVA